MASLFAKDQKKYSIKTEMKKFLNEKFSSLNVHALPNIVKTNHLSIKILWTMYFILSGGFCTYFMINTILNYFNYEITSKINISYERMLSFPIVTICNVNPFATNYINQKLQFLFNTTSPSFQLFYLSKSLANQMTDRNLNGPGIKDIIIYCQFSMVKCDLDADFEHYYDINYGNCYRFNSGKNMNGTQVNQKYTFKSGQFGSLDIEFFIGSASENQNILSKLNGFVIFITNYTLDSSYTEGIQISPGYSTAISLNKYSIVKQPKPYSQCIDDLTNIDSYDSALFRKFFSLNQTYHYSNCELLCFQKYLKNNCQCQTTLVDVVYDENMRKCSSRFDNIELDFGDYFCTTSSWLNFSQSFETMRECDCPLECETTAYTYQTSMCEYPTQNYVKYLAEFDLIKKKYAGVNKSSINYDDLRKKVAQVQIYFNEMKQTVINELPKTTIADLVSSIGGTFGLFLGIR